MSIFMSLPSFPPSQNFTDAFHHVTPPPAKISQMNSITLHLPPTKISQMHSIMLHLPPPPKFHMHSITLHLHPTKISHMHSIMLHLLPSPRPKFHRCIPSRYNTNIPTLNVVRHNADKHSCLFFVIVYFHCRTQIHARTRTRTPNPMATKY